MRAQQLALRAAAQQPRRAAAARRAMRPSAGAAAASASSPVALPSLTQAEETETEANAAAVRSALLAAGLTPEQVAAAAAREPRLFAFSAAREVSPRLAYLAFLRDAGWGWTGAEGVPSYVARQPAVLERSFQVVHRCAHFVAIAKPWDTRHDVPRGWPGKERFAPKFEGDTSAEEWLEAELRATHPRLDKVRLTHQLDFATSGVLLGALSRGAAAAAARCFADRTAVKRYRLLVLGHPAADTWCRTDALSYDPTDPAGFRMRCHPSVDDGAAPATGPTAAKRAETAFRVLARGACALHGPFLGAPVAYVEAAPSTGRRHQIRVHAAASGHPLLGDAAYSPDLDSFRTFLHAASLELPLAPTARERAEWARSGGGGAGETHPFDRTLRIRAPLPHSFAAAMTPPPPPDEEADA